MEILALHLVQLQTLVPEVFVLLSGYDYFIMHYLRPGQTRMRVAKSSNSRLAWNSHALSATLMRSRRIWTCSDFSWESPRGFSRLARADDNPWELKKTLTENSNGSQLSATPLLLVWAGLYSVATTYFEKSIHRTGTSHGIFLFSRSLTLKLNSSTIDEHGKGACKVGGATCKTSRARRVTMTTLWAATTRHRHTEIQWKN